MSSLLRSYVLGDMQDLARTIEDLLGAHVAVVVLHGSIMQEVYGRGLCLFFLKHFYLQSENAVAMCFLY